MKRFEVKGEEQIAMESAMHSAEDKRATTAKKTKIRKAHAAIIKRLFPKAKSMLCIGCRDDSEVQDFINAGFDAIGIDVANESKLIKRCDAHKMDALFAKHQFDVIYSSHSLEHMYDAALAMNQMRRVAKSGIFIILPKGGMRKGSDPAEPSANHPSIFDIMTSSVSKLNELKTVKKSLLEDFSHFGKIKAEHFKTEDRQLELALRFIND